MSLPTDLYRAPPHKLKDKVHRIGQVDVTAVASQLAQKTTEEWLENASRQKQFAVHRDTESLVLKWCANTAVDTPVETTRHYADFLPVIQPILDAIQTEYRYENPLLRKVVFAKLKSRGVIPEHVDGAIALRMVHRIHIPIVTNNDVHFFIDNTDFHLATGEIVEVDNTRFHSVENRSALDRVHLIVDYYHA